MPAKNSIKIYIDEGIYHIYNRGVEKRNIFEDPQDYKVFLRFLKEALSPPPNKEDILTSITVQGQTFKGIPRQPKNFHQKIQLLAYCLMPNHFHLLIKQTSAKTINEFMQALITRYSIYFNHKNKRVGTLFQGRYKGTLVSEEPYLLHLTRYIHRNPKAIGMDIIDTYSSYADYLGLHHTSWVYPDLILSFFKPGSLPSLKHTNTYQNFVEEESIESENILESLILEQTEES